MRFTFNLNKKEFSMRKIKMFSLTAGLVLAMTFTFSCSGDDGGEDGGSSSSTEGGGQGGGSSSSGGGGDGNSITYGNDTYPIVVIGTQTWLAKNLNYAVEGSKCYDNDPANCVKYGRLYDWATAMALPSSCNENSCSSQIQTKHKGICPSGWHLPSYDDWYILIDYVGGYETAGTKLKATNDWNGNGNGMDEFEFSALPGGYGYSDGLFADVDEEGRWWIAGEDINGSAYILYMVYDGELAYWHSYKKSNLLSVRCVKD